ncbi:SPOR domain-containing protein [Psychrobacter sp. I-STPA6b]|uniref:SPOR domain-containing protein n=1 Tax=Psychrobacter sp. I-STPA6b TaxID=2585718 RepID=UPI001D0CB3BC|nr:SPOR domain-containing protein [Psychrobacter sp. I-STPA6b]
MLAKKPKGATQKQSGGGISGLIWMFVGAVLTLMIGLFLYLWNPFDMGNSDPVAPSSTVQPKVQTDTDNPDYEFYDLLPEQQITNIPDEAIINERPQQDRDYLEEALTPDVVVVVPTPTDEAPRETREQSTGDFEVSEDTVLTTPSQSQRSSADNEIIVVEEAETYEGNTASERSSEPAQAEQPRTSYILQINSFSNAEEADRRRAQVLMAGVDAQVIKNETASGQVIYQVISNRMNNRQNVVRAQQRLQNNGIDSLIVEQRR